MRRKIEETLVISMGFAFCACASMNADSASDHGAVIETGATFTTLGTSVSHAGIQPVEYPPSWPHRDVLRRSALQGQKAF